MFMPIYMVNIFCTGIQTMPLFCLTSWLWSLNDKDPPTGTIHRLFCNSGDGIMCACVCVHKSASGWMYCIHFSYQLSIDEWGYFNFFYLAGLTGGLKWYSNVLRIFGCLNYVLLTCLFPSLYLAQEGCTQTGNAKNISLVVWNLILLGGMFWLTKISFELEHFL